MYITIIFFFSYFITRQLTIKENSRPGTVLFELLVSDADYLYGRRDMFKYTLNGEGANNFQVKEVRCFFFPFLTTLTSPLAPQQHLLQLKV